jgi:hypothetical protein
MMNHSDAEFKLNDWLVEGVHGMKAQRRRVMKGLVPQEFGKHVRAARKEMLLAVGSLIDDAIEHTEKKDKEPHSKVTTIKVE